MLKIAYRFTLFILILLSSLSPLHAQEKESQGIPPAKVVVSEVNTGMVAPEAEFIGTVYYQEVSDVSSEVSGKVEAVNFIEGQRVKKGYKLVKLGSDLLEKTLEATIALHEQVLSELQKARKDLKRVEILYRKDLATEQAFDEKSFMVKGLEKKSASLMADVERLEIELKKKTIEAPFDGVVIKKHIDRAEWLSPGSIIATIAKDDVVEVIVEVPERIIRFLKKGMYVNVEANEKLVNGEIIAIIPRGDISTRTFPVKIRIPNTFSLIEGMEARVTLPAGERKKTLTIPRDAVITVFGKTVVFAVVNSKAKMIPVKVTGYRGMIAGIYADGLTEGMKVVVKGNERLMDGQMVEIKE